MSSLKLCIATILIVALSSGVLQAQPTTIFTYQGELRNGGSPASGLFDLSFSLWTLDVGGTQIGSANLLNSVPVVDGRFTVELDFGSAAFNNNERWLQVAVNGITLSPRTPINRTPYAIQTRGIFADATERIGLGTTVPAARLDVRSTTANSNDNTARFTATALGPRLSHVHFGVTGDWFIRSASNSGKVVVQDSTGIVGIGTANPSDSAKLSISAPAEEKALLALSLDPVQPTIQASNIGGGAAIWATGSSDVSPSGGGLLVVGAVGELNTAYDSNEIMARNNGAAATLLINREGGNVAIGSASGGTSTLSAPVIQITGGADFSEMFDVGGDAEVQPGMVVSIDPNNPGRLVQSTVQFDRRVAGIISGAGGVATGMTMGHDGTIASGKYPVALSGRVYCLVDATDGRVIPGDMLTTSTNPGHAMKVDDPIAASGAIIGKAMTSLEKGEIGLVLVLVNLQ